MIKDSPSSRSPDTAMRDLLRRLERLTISPPARPNNPPPPAAPMALSTGLAGPHMAEQAPVAIGQWVLVEDSLSGDLVARHADGTVRTLASRGDH